MPTIYIVTIRYLLVTTTPAGSLHQLWHIKTTREGYQSTQAF